jgi:hypothetical protein
MSALSKYPGYYVETRSRIADRSSWAAIETLPATPHCLRGDRTMTENRAANPRYTFASLDGTNAVVGARKYRVVRLAKVSLGQYH